jgi:hypothetical protein
MKNLQKDQHVYFRGEKRKEEEKKLVCFVSRISSPRKFLLSGQSNDGLYVLFKHLFSYLKGTTTHDLHITRSSSFALLGFTDANWAGSIADKKSTGDYPVFFGQTLISWKSGKQRTVAHSSTEAEYKALADDTTEVIWLQYLLTNLQILSIFAPIIWCQLFICESCFSCSHKTC